MCKQHLATKLSPPSPMALKVRCEGYSFTCWSSSRHFSCSSGRKTHHCQRIRSCSEAEPRGGGGGRWELHLRFAGAKNEVVCLSLPPLFLRQVCIRRHAQAGTLELPAPLPPHRPPAWRPPSPANELCKASAGCFFGPPPPPPPLPLADRCQLMPLWPLARLGNAAALSKRKPGRVDCMSSGTGASSNSLFELSRSQRQRCTRGNRGESGSRWHSARWESPPWGDPACWHRCFTVHSSQHRRVRTAKLHDFGRRFGGPPPKSFLTNLRR